MKRVTNEFKEKEEENKFLIQEVARFNESYEIKKEEERERTKIKIKMETELKSSLYKLNQIKSDMEEVQYLTARPI